MQDGLFECFQAGELGGLEGAELADVRGEGVELFDDCFLFGEGWEWSFLGIHTLIDFSSKDAIFGLIVRSLTLELGGPARGPLCFIG